MASAAPGGGPGKLNVRQAAFIGAGAMVGAGIVALLGSAGEVAGVAVWAGESTDVRPGVA